MRFKEVKKVLKEFGGYVPVNDAEARDPRFKMAISQDIKPGEVQRQAKKMGWTTDPAGVPPLLTTKNKFGRVPKSAFKDRITESRLQEDEDLFEINMSPSNLEKLAGEINARAGMEFEMIVPNVQDEDEGNWEPDYDQDQRSRSWSDIRDFFYDGDHNSRREVDRLIEQMNDEFLEWMDEQIDENWQEEEYEMVKDWVIDNVSEDDILDAGYYEEDDREKFQRDKEFYNKVIDDYVKNAIEEKTNDYEEARDLYREERYGDFDESEWLDLYYRYMSDIDNTFEINWPYWNSPSDGEADVDTVASDFELAIDKPVKASRSYHGARRDDTSYIVEPDSSLDADDINDAGLEFVSPPMSVPDMLDDLTKVYKWAKSYNCYTNESTGLHMNVSIPDFSLEKLDYIKLALLVGDEYVLDQFGRRSNSYARSAISKIKERGVNDPDKIKELFDHMRGSLSTMASQTIHGPETAKYTSINIHDNYVEFRSPGGDWLGQDLDKIKNTVLRFVVALDAACKPDKYRQDYLKKLYKLFEIKSEKDPLSYFAQFVKGELPFSALKSFIKQAQLTRKAKAGKLEPGVDYVWEVRKQGSSALINVIAQTEEEAIDKATNADGYPEWRGEPGVKAKVLRKASSGTKDRFQDIPSVTDPRPAGEAGSIKYELFNRGSGIVMRTYWAANDDMALDMGRRYRDEAAREFDMDTGSIGLRRARSQPAPRSGDFTGTWLIKDANGRVIHRISGIGNAQSDANRHAMNWLRQNPDQMQQGVEVVPELR
jgi:hypothetical protein